MIPFFFIPCQSIPFFYTHRIPTCKESRGKWWKIGSPHYQVYNESLRKSACLRSRCGVDDAHIHKRRRVVRMSVFFILHALMKICREGKAYFALPLCMCGGNQTTSTTCVPFHLFSKLAHKAYLLKGV